MTYTAEDIARVRTQAEARRQDLIRQRILAIRHADRLMPAKEIAFRVGVSIAVVEQALGVKAAPGYVG